MRLVNFMIWGILCALPILWVAVLSMSLFQAISAIYEHADRTALLAVR
jgi:hypothetical protein